MCLYPGSSLSVGKRKKQVHSLQHFYAKGLLSFKRLAHVLIFHFLLYQHNVPYRAGFKSSWHLSTSGMSQQLNSLFSNCPSFNKQDPSLNRGIAEGWVPPPTSCFSSRGCLARWGAPWLPGSLLPNHGGSLCPFCVPFCTMKNQHRYVLSAT